MPPYRTIPSNEEPQVSPDTVTAIEKAPEQPLDYGQAILELLGLIPEYNRRYYLSVNQSIFREDS